jgi:hypothetical protein
MRPDPTFHPLGGFQKTIKISLCVLQTTSASYQVTSERTAIRPAKMFHLCILIPVPFQQLILVLRTSQFGKEIGRVNIKVKLREGLLLHNVH